MRNKALSALFVMYIAVATGCKESPQPPDSDTVAVYDGGTVTKKEIETTINSIRETIRGANTEEFRIDTKEAHVQIINSIVLDKLIRRKVSELKMDQRENLKHVMKHVSEELNISGLHSKAHEENRIEVSEEEIRNRYEQDKEKFAQYSLSELSEQIKASIQAEKEKQFFQTYLKDLRQNAVVTINNELLQMPIPTETDLRVYYDQNRNNFAENTFDEVKSRIYDTVRKTEEERWLLENGNRTLLTIHGKRFTVGEFYEEISEISPAERERYNDYESKQMLLEKMIDRLLLVEDAYDQLINSKIQNEQGHVREDILMKVMHQEDVDDKIKISNEEIKNYYVKNSNILTYPPKVKINYIRIRAGESEPENEKAKDKILEAYHKIIPGLFQTGEMFEKVAAQYSEDAESAKSGGALDKWISEDSDINSEINNHKFHKIVLRLKTSEVSEPFYFHGSYYIVQVRERQEPKPMTFDEARGIIENELKNRKHEEMTIQIEQSLLDQSRLVIFDDAIKSMLTKTTKRP